MSGLRARTVELSDRDEIQAFLVAAYGTRVRLRGPDRQLFRHRRLDTGSLSVATAEQRASLECAVDPLHAVVVTRVTSGRLERTCDGAERRYAPGDLLLVAHPDRPCRVVWEAGEITNCVIDPALLARVAATAPARRSEPIRFTALDPPSAATAARWWAARTYVADLLAEPGADTAPLVLANALNLLAAATLVTFPNTALTEPTIEDRHDASGATLRRAVVFIDEHPTADIGVTDIAAAAGVSARAVQLAFRRHLDTTPMAYLRRVRLDHAHRQLVAADPARATVSEIATRWGFGSHSRFTALYHQAYGVLPRETLNRR